jgi:cell division protein FtsB
MKMMRSPAPADAVHGAPRLPQRRAGSPWIRRGLVFLACLILLDSLFGDRGLAQTMRARRDYQRAIVELGRVKDHNGALRDEIRRLEADPAAIEAVARQELGLVRPGEILVLVKDAR